MSEAGVCAYTEDGQHRLFGRPWRMPVAPILAMPFKDPPTEPTPLRYWEIDECRFCGYQHSTPHGFTPRREAKP